jgi:hypothetical protein
MSIWRVQRQHPRRMCVTNQKRFGTPNDTVAHCVTARFQMFFCKRRSRVNEKRTCCVRWLRITREPHALKSQTKHDCGLDQRTQVQEAARSRRNVDGPHQPTLGVGEPAPCLHHVRVRRPIQANRPAVRSSHAASRRVTLCHVTTSHHVTSPHHITVCHVRFDHARKLHLFSH